MKYPPVSVIIPTIDRARKMKNCLVSVLDNSFPSFEVCVVDQSEGGETENLVKKLNAEKIKYFHLNKVGKSLALNFALSKTRAEIVCFTDDDCVVDRNWLKEIFSSFRNHKQIDGVFGSSFGYRPQKNGGLYCPSVFNRKEKQVIAGPANHWSSFGFGNNMSFRSEVFRDLSGFKTWLGPGSVGKYGEETEFCYRYLDSGRSILYNPKVKIYHDNWIDSRRMTRLKDDYNFGLYAAYGYHAVRSRGHARKFLLEALRERARRARKDLFNALWGGHWVYFAKRVLIFPSRVFYHLKWLGLVIYYSFFKKEAACESKLL